MPSRSKSALPKAVVKPAGPMKKPVAPVVVKRPVSVPAKKDGVKKRDAKAQSKAI